MPHVPPPVVFHGISFLPAGTTTLAKVLLNQYLVGWDRTAGSRRWPHNFELLCANYAKHAIQVRKG